MAKINLTPPIVSERHIKRFWRKVNKAANNECWYYTTDPDPDGYGRFRIQINLQSRRYKASRFSHFLATGRWPNLSICHTCDNVQCVNPSHLFEGTTWDNAEDARQKGRLASGHRHGSRTHPENLKRGTSHGLAKLTDAQVTAIRQLHAIGVTPKSLAEKFATDRSNVYLIVKRRTWVHI